MIAATPDLPAHIAEGDFRRCSPGAPTSTSRARYETRSWAIARATGRPLGPQPFLRHLETRYLAR